MQLAIPDSFRIGSATTAAACGIEDSLIQTLGHWKSAAYLRYIRIPREQLANLSVVLAKSVNRSMQFVAKVGILYICVYVCMMV